MREKLLLVFAGLIVGVFVGFLFAGSIPQRGSKSTRQMPASVSNALVDAQERPDNFDS